MVTTNRTAMLVVAIVGLLAAQALADAPARRQPRKAQPHAQRREAPQREVPLRRDCDQDRVPHRVLPIAHQHDHRPPHRVLPCPPCPPWRDRVRVLPCPLWRDRVWVPAVYETRTVLERVWVPPVREMRLVRRGVWVPATSHRPGYMRYYDSYESVEVRGGYYTDRCVTRSVCVRPGHWEFVMRVGW